MKKINTLVAVLVAAFFMVSCGKDDAPASNAPKEELKDDPSESLPIPLSILENDISIKGAKKVQGMPPPPSGIVDFKLDAKTPMGIQKTGFDIQFTSSSNIAGAYVLVQTVGGEKAKSYFDIPVDSLKQNNFIAGRFLKSSKRLNTKIAESNEFIADVNFTENVTPGEFCYEICIYDADGNVSVIEERCIKVEAWAGNLLVGKWIYDRTEPNDNLIKLQCENGDSIQVGYVMHSKKYLELFLGANGDYYMGSEEKYKELNYKESIEKCLAIYYGEEKYYKNKYTGNWLYNTEKELLVIVDFKYEDLLDSSKNKTYPNGESLMIAEAKIIDDELHLIDEEEEKTYILKR